MTHFKAKRTGLNQLIRERREAALARARSLPLDSVSVLGADLWAVKSARSGDVYEVRRSGEAWSCMCPNWTLESRDNPDHQCKHVLLVQLALGLIR